MNDADLTAEVERLRRRVDRERRARQEAEALAEHGTRELYARAREVQLLFVLADAANRAASADEALQIALDELCAYTGWPVGHAYLVTRNPGLPLSSTTLWHLENPEQFASFRAATEAQRFAHGEGLPGRVLQSGVPVFVPDVRADPNFPRAAEALAIGVRGAFAIPVTAGREMVAVLEFFSREESAPDPQWMNVAGQAAAQIGRVFEREARHEAERASRAKSEFLSRMSHELRTPLNAILGFGELLAMEELPPRQREGVRHILKAGRHLLNLINEVLDISRIESGHMPVSLEPVGVARMLEESLDLTGPLAAQHGVTIEAHDALASRDYVLADAQRLKQILINLLSNAVKYNRRGGRVKVRVDARGKRLRLAVTDTGAGIPEHRLDSLFTPFERLGAELGAVEGTGLGLALSKGLAELMGGCMGVESKPGDGSTFWVELGLTEGPIHGLEQTALDHAPLPPAARANRTIIYIEDNLSNFQLVEGILTHRPGFKVVAAMHVRLGLELAQEHQPHLILLDLNLPDVSGYEALLLLRANPATQSIPVLVVSADATTKQIERLLAAGAEGYLTKPLDVRQFITTIDRILSDGAPPC